MLRLGMLQTPGCVLVVMMFSVPIKYDYTKANGNRNDHSPITAHLINLRNPRFRLHPHHRKPTKPPPTNHSPSQKLVPGLNRDHPTPRPKLLTTRRNSNFVAPKLINNPTSNPKASR